MKNKDIFISYKMDEKLKDGTIIKNDTDIVMKISEYIESKSKYSCWVCEKEKSYLAGENYKTKIENEVIPNAKIVICIVSKKALESESISAEISLAKNNNKKIIPFRIEQDARSEHKLDFANNTPIEYDKNSNEPFKELLEAIDVKIVKEKNQNIYKILLNLIC